MNDQLAEPSGCFCERRTEKERRFRETRRKTALYNLSKSEANEHLFEMNKNNYSGRTDSGRSRASVVIKRQRQGVCMYL